MKKFIIIQWGKERSIIQHTDYHYEIYIINNQQLMNLDERGLIHD